MADILSATLAFTVSPQGGPGNVPYAEPSKLLPETHAIRMDDELTIQAGVTDYFLDLSKFASVSFIFLELTGGGNFTYKKGSTSATANTCRHFSLNTPNAESISGLYISTGSTASTIHYLIFGD